MGYPQEKALLPNYVDLQFPAAKKLRVRPHLQFLFGAVLLSIIISCSHQFPTSNLDVLRQEFPILQARHGGRGGSHTSGGNNNNNNLGQNNNNNLETIG